MDGQRYRIRPAIHLVAFLNGPCVVSETVNVTILICAYNGDETVPKLLESALAQDTGGEFQYEILVVDNNSTDRTAAMVLGLAEKNPERIRLLKETTQGKSYALNTGLKSARGEICCVIDQDEQLTPGYLRQVWSAFQQHPGVSFLSGKVLPLWPAEVPEWITREHWSPLAICDYGEQPFLVNRERLVCLLTGCFRTAHMRAVGGYRELLGITPGRLGSVEDAELYERMVEAGYTGMYVPEIVVYHRIGLSRLNKPYHRRWHRGHGGYVADMRSRDFESSRFRIVQIPGHVIRQAAQDAVALLSLAARGQWSQAFSRELQLQFFMGFVLRRWGISKAV